MIVDCLNHDDITEYESNELCEDMCNFFNMDVYNRSKLMMNNAEYKKFTEIPPVTYILINLIPAWLIFLFV